MESRGIRLLVLVVSMLLWKWKFSMSQSSWGHLMFPRSLCRPFFEQGERAMQQVPWVLIMENVALWNRPKNSKTHSYNPDVDGDFLWLAWWNHVIHNSGESKGQVVGLDSYSSIWRPNLSCCIIVMRSMDQQNMQQKHILPQGWNQILISSLNLVFLSCVPEVFVIYSCFLRRTCFKMATHARSLQDL